MTTQYKEVKRKANVGEHIKIVNAMCAYRYGNGDEGIVEKSEESGVFAEINGERSGIWHAEYVVLVPVESAPSLPDLIAQFLRENYVAVRKFIEEITPEPTVLTFVEPKLNRAQVIAKAKADVAELLQIGQDSGGSLPQGQFKSKFYTAEFHVNREKRVVTALVSTTYWGGEVSRRNVAKATAKCAAGDVFHAEIGKAIALRKALGLTVPSEYLNAPQPDEPRVGAIVQAYDYRGNALELITVRKVRAIDGEIRMYRVANSDLYCRYEPQKTGDHIIDDTDVDYESSAEVAA